MRSHLQSLLTKTRTIVSALKGGLRLVVCSQKGARLLELDNNLTPSKPLVSHEIT